MVSVHLICGKTGSGKTTFAHELERERSAVRFSHDEWMIHLYGHHMPREVFDIRVQLCMDLILRLTERLVALGVEVVLDCAFWRYADRQKARSYLARSRANCILYYLDLPDEILLQRLRHRNQQLPQSTFEITEEMFHEFEVQFEPPLDDERPIIVKPRK